MWKAGAEQIPKLTVRVRFPVARYGRGGLFGRAIGRCLVSQPD